MPLRRFESFYYDSEKFKDKQISLFLSAHIINNKKNIYSTIIRNITPVVMTIFS